MVAVLLIFSGFVYRYLKGGFMVLLLYEEEGLISNGQSFLKCSFLKVTSDISKVVHSHGHCLPETSASPKLVRTQAQHQLETYVSWSHPAVES